MRSNRSDEPERAAGRPVGRTVHELLEIRSQLQPERVAIATDDGRALTFAEWHTGARVLAGALVRRGIGRGDRWRCASGCGTGRNSRAATAR